MSDGPSRWGRRAATRRLRRRASDPRARSQDAKHANILQMIFSTEAGAISEMVTSPTNIANPVPSRRSIFLIAAMIAAGFGLTLFVFYPGIMTYDARYVYEDIAAGFLGDWQSPVMTVLWSFIDPIAPGSASMFLLIVTIYWLAFG